MRMQGETKNRRQFLNKYVKENSQQTNKQNNNIIHDMDDKSVFQ